MTAKETARLLRILSGVFASLAFGAVVVYFNAECVMLNKGPHIFKTIHALDGILSRMQAHQFKKTSMLRSLLVARMSE